MCKMDSRIFYFTRVLLAYMKTHVFIESQLVPTRHSHDFVWDTFVHAYHELDSIKGVNIVP